MQKIWALILLSALVSNCEALPQTKWSRPIRNLQGQLTRERRQFPFGEWIPLTQSCPTCRLFADPLDAGLRGENIGLTPPRPTTVTRQINGEGNFFPQDESSILSVPPPPPNIGATNGNFRFSGFGQQLNNPLPVHTQKVVPQSQQIQFFPQTFLPNQPLLVNGNPQILTGINGQSNLFTQHQTQPLISNGKLTSFQNSDFKTQKLPENVLLEQNKRPLAPKPFSNKPQPFTQSQQNQQQTFAQPQLFSGQRQQSANFGNNILTPPPAPNNVTQDVTIPGLDKEEIQLLYVPVETLRQKGTPQEQLLTQQPQNIQFHSRPNSSQRPVNNIRPTEQALVTQPPTGHFLTQNGNNGKQTDSTLKVTSVQPFSTPVTPSTLLLQHLPFQPTPQPFVSATPSTPTVQPFSTPASVFQKFSSFAPETTLSHLSTVPNTIQFSQSDIDFGTTPKTIFNQEVFGKDIINRKPEFSDFSNQEQERPFAQQPLQQAFINQGQVVTNQHQQNTVFKPENQRGIPSPNPFPQQINQQQIALQKQQENQRLLQEQRQKELEEQRYLEQQRKQKELEEQRYLEQQRKQKELEEQRYLEQQRKQKELEEKRLIQQQRQKELEQQQFIQKQKELEEQRLLQQQRQKELEQQRFLQKQKQLEEQRLLQQQNQKELEQQRYLQKQKELEQQRLLQQQRQKELEEQRFLEEQKQRELEYQRRLQLQKQKELEEKRLLQQLKQKEEEQQRFLRFQQQQKELEQQKLLQEQQQRLLQQQKLQKQKQESLKNQQQFQFLQQKQSVPQQALQQKNRHVLPDSDKLNLIPELEKESESEDKLVPHQPPLSVFFKGYNGAEARITDVLRELRSSNTIIVLDQYFEKMPKVFVGPAGLTPPTGYGKFDLPYLSNLESNRIDRRIDKLPFFVAPLNFVPPPGYAKIPFPAPHVGSVVVSSESNPAMKLKSVETGFNQPFAEEENISGSYPVVGPELPGLINNLDKITTTAKPTTYVSTPSLPQTTAQLRNRRPNSSLYKPQNRKPITRTRSSTTSKPEEEVTQPIQKTEVTKDSEGIRKPFNRFLYRRRQQTKTTTESSLKGQQDSKNIENRYYSVEVYHQDKNQVPRTQLKSDFIHENQPEEQLNRHFEQSTGSIDRITPRGNGDFEGRPTPDYSTTHQTVEAVESEKQNPDTSDYIDINLQSFEDGPLPTGSAKTITQELYRPNVLSRPQEEVNFKALSKPENTFTSDKFSSANNEDFLSTKFVSDSLPTSAADTNPISEEQVSVQPTLVAEPERQDASSEKVDSTTAAYGEVPFTSRPVTVSTDHQTKGLLDLNEKYTSDFGEIPKHHQVPDFADSSKKHLSTFSEVHPTPEISINLEAPSQDFVVSGEVRLTENPTEPEDNKFFPTGSSAESHLPEGEEASQNQSEIFSSQVSPSAPGATDGLQYTAGFSDNSKAQNSAEFDKNSDDKQSPSFIGLHDIPSPENSSENPQQYFPSLTPQAIITEINPPVSTTTETLPEISVHPSAQTYISESIKEESVRHNEPTQVTEVHGQEVSDNLPRDHRLKLSNPSIVRVRTRTRNKSRGQVNFAASQSTTSAPFTRPEADNRHNENVEQDFTTKTNHFREYNPTKTSKYNQFRGVKKPVRITTEATTESEQKANVYTIRPQRRPLSPSTVSTKRIRRPTTPLPSIESSTEAFGTPIGGSYSQSEQSQHFDFSPSGVSNDVYYEQSSLSPVKNKFRKSFISAEQKKDVVSGYSSTAFPPTSPTYTPVAYDGSSEEYNIIREPTDAVTRNENYPDKYPEWNPAESGFDVSGVVLTTDRTPGHEDHSRAEDEEPKKFQDSKKAFDPDLEKKTGRRRVRVRVHKRPHENFETAESQNLRTVANVLVPPTTTYKPNDESNFHQLAKNSDFSFGGQKLFGVRSREYFKKRLNLSESEGVSKGEQSGKEVGAPKDSTATLKPLGLLRKTQKSEFASPSAQSDESNEGSKNSRPKFRGYVRKIIKHGGDGKNKETNASQEIGNEENKEKHSSQTFRVNQGGFNHTGRVNGTKHKTLVRYIKKSKIRPHETESHVESSVRESHEEGESLNQTTESHPNVSEFQQQTPKIDLPSTEVHQTQEELKQENKDLETPIVQQGEISESQESETTTEPEVRQTQQPLIQTTTPVELKETSTNFSQSNEEITFQTFTSTASPTQQSVLYLTQRSKFFPTLRPVFSRTSQSGFHRTKEPEVISTTEQTQKTQELQEKRNGYSRFKYGKTTSLATATEKAEESKKGSEQQLKNKNFHTLEVRKYLRTKSREGAFSQFSRNRYFSSEKTESDGSKEQPNSEKESEEIITERNSEISETELTSIEPETTQAFDRTDSLEIASETPKTDDEPQATTTEAIRSSEEQSSKEESEEITSSVNYETTTEVQAPTTAFRVSSTPTPLKPTTENAETQATEIQPDIYRFSKDSFSFDETEKFTGTKNRAHVRNITTDIIENTASFSAPGIEKRTDIRVVTHSADEVPLSATETLRKKTEEATTEFRTPETTTEYPDTETTATPEGITKAKAAKVLKTSTTTKVSHETEICYKGKCIRTKSDNPDDDLKLLVDSASTMRIQKRKT